MDQQTVFELAEGYEDFSGGSVSLVDGKLFDVGQALEEGNGRIILAPYPRYEEGEQPTDAEAERANYDTQVNDALVKYPGLVQIDAEGAEPAPSLALVDPTDPATESLTQLRARASELDVPGRSSMNKAQLEAGIEAKETELAQHTSPDASTDSSSSTTDDSSDDDDDDNDENQGA